MECVWSSVQFWIRWSVFGPLSSSGLDGVCLVLCSSGLDGVCLVLCSSLHAAEADVSPGETHHPADCTHLGPERLGSAAHDGAREESAGQVPAAAGQPQHGPG